MPSPLTNNQINNRSSLIRFAWLSVAAAIVTIALKGFAYLFTGSVGLLSDAAESLVNLLGGIIATITLTVAVRPPDENHAFGHDKAEYFSSGVEGALILIASVSIAVTAVNRLFSPHTLEKMGLGLSLSIAASLVNLGVALVLLRVGRQNNSITLEANARHLMTDVWTSAGILVGLGAVALTGWQRLDPIIALVVACNIVWTGVRLVRRSILGLMDTALLQEDQDEVRRVLNQYANQGVHYHALRTRQSGARRFVSVHVLVPGAWTVQRGHQMLELVEHNIREALPNTIVFTHLESLEDAASWHDIELDHVET